MSRKLLFSFSRKDFRIDYFRGTGPGGQHRNKKDTAVRITHLESRLSAESQNSRSQSDNKKKAFKKLVDLLMDHYMPKDDLRPRHDLSQMKATRSYNEPDDRVVDHVTGDRFSYRQTVGRNDISKIIETRAIKVLSSEQEKK